MMRRRSLTSVSGSTTTGSAVITSRATISATGGVGPERCSIWRCASTRRTSRNVSTPARRPSSITTSDPISFSAIVMTHSDSIAEGATVNSALPFTRSTSLTCMTTSHPAPGYPASVGIVAQRRKPDKPRPGPVPYRDPAGPDVGAPPPGPLRPITASRHRQPGCRPFAAGLRCAPPGRLPCMAWSGKRRPLPPMPRPGACPTSGR